jgi:hypothetical protein
MSSVLFQVWKSAGRRISSIGRDLVANKRSDINWPSVWAAVAVAIAILDAWQTPAGDMLSSGDIAVLWKG